MPCVYYETPEEIAANKKAKRKELENKYKRELDLVTNHLCYVLKELEDIGENYSFINNLMNDNEDLAKWWENHKKMDEARKKELISSAKSKLTKEEVEALNL